MRRFVCSSFDYGNERVLAVEMTLSCPFGKDGVPQNFWALYAILMFCVYPVFVPTFLLFVLYQNRVGIEKIMRVLMREEARLRRQ